MQIPRISHSVPRFGIITGPVKAFYHNDEPAIQCDGTLPELGDYVASAVKDPKVTAFTFLNGPMAFQGKFGLAYLHEDDRVIVTEMDRELEDPLNTLSPDLVAKIKSEAALVQATHTQKWGEE